MARYLVFPSARSTRLMTGEREPSTDAYLPCTMRNDSLAADSLSCEVTETRKLPPPSGAAAGAVCVGLVAATRVDGSDSPACGASDIGALALALADAGLRVGGAAGAAAGAATDRVGGAGRGGGALAPAGMPPLSAASPLAGGVLFMRGTICDVVPEGRDVC